MTKSRISLVIFSVFLSLALVPFLAQARELTTFSKNLKRGVASTDVKKLQVFLGEIKVFQGQATGYFGPTTERAVKKFQSDNGLKVTGLVDASTNTKLNELAQDTEARFLPIAEKEAARGFGWIPPNPYRPAPPPEKVPTHASVADLKLAPMEDWLPTTYRGFSPGNHLEATYLRPPDWVATYLNGDSAQYVDVRGTISKSPQGVWGTLDIIMSPIAAARSEPKEQPGTPVERFTFDDGSQGIWIKTVKVNNTGAIQPLVHQALTRYTADGKYVIVGDFRASYPKDAAGAVDAKALAYYEEALKKIVGSAQPKPLDIPSPATINIKNCKLEPYFTQYEYGSRVTFNNLDNKAHTLYSFEVKGFIALKIKVPAKGKADYVVDLGPRLLYDVSCDKITPLPHTKLLTPPEFSGWLYVPPAKPEVGDTVIIRNCKAFPYELRVPDGGTVTFKNEDASTHKLIRYVYVPNSLSREEVLTVPARGSATKQFFIQGGGIATTEIFKCNKEEIRLLVAKPEYSP